MADSTQTIYQTNTQTPDPMSLEYRRSVMPLITAAATTQPNIYGMKFVPAELDEKGFPKAGTGIYVRDPSVPLTAAPTNSDIEAANARVRSTDVTGTLGKAGTAFDAAQGTDIAGANQGLYGAASRANIADAAGGLYQQAANAPVYGGLDALKQGQELYRQAGAANSGAAGQSQYNQAQNMYQNAPGAYNAYGNAASDLYGQSTNPTGLSSASPYLQAAAGKSTSGISDYMNPYNAAVTDQIAKLGARNLSENILPSISDQFVSGGQFGSTRQGQMSDRALRDTQEAILAQQSAALQAGYGQAAGLSANDLARQAQLAGTAGGLGTSQQQILQGAGAGISNVGSTRAGLGMQAAQGIQSIGASNIQASQADLARQIQAATGLDTSAMTVGQLANMAGQLQLQAGQGLTSAAQAQAANQIASGNAMTNAAASGAANNISSGLANQGLASAGQNLSLQLAGAQQAIGEDTRSQAQNVINADQSATNNAQGAILNNLTAGAGAAGATPGSVVLQNQSTTSPGGSTLGQLAGAGATILGGIKLATGKAEGGPIKKDSLKKARYGNIPRRGLGMFARAG